MLTAATRLAFLNIVPEEAKKKKQIQTMIQKKIVGSIATSWEHIVQLQA
jgi:hypothetical protein